MPTSVKDFPYYVQKSVLHLMEEEMNTNNETHFEAEGLDEFNGSEDENVNEVEGLDFEEINFRLLNEDEVKKYREGFRDKKNELVRKRAPRKETRCGCLARMKIHIDNKKGDWYVNYFVDEHNHELVGEHYGAMIASNRRMTETDVAQMNTMREVGIGTGNIFGSFAGQCGGYRHTVDEEGKLQQLFWADGCSIFDYSIGDVLTFDATYGRNKYKFPVVIFSSVNHHKQTIVFGAAVVSNETEETYIWLLEKFLEAMIGKQPKCVITDGDLSMKNAIKRFFPEAHHRLCVWHICNNAGKNIKKNNFHKDFQKVMYVDVDIDDFNMMWEELIAKHGLHNNAWAAQIFDCRKLIAKHGLHNNAWAAQIFDCRSMWARSYIRGKFYAGLHTTSRLSWTLNARVKEWNLLGCHVVSVFVLLILDISQLPSCLVLERWTKKAKDVQGVNFQQCELSKESVNISRYGALSDACRVLCNLACKTEEDFTEMLEKVYNECSRLRSKQHSSTMENVDNATGDQVRDQFECVLKVEYRGLPQGPSE
ncbi:hypothetical protein Lal_00042527, partial [Lupinus albus]